MCYNYYNRGGSVKRVKKEKKVKNIKLLIIWALMIISIFLLTYYICYYRVKKINLIIIGDNDARILFGEEYQEEGYIANVCSFAKCEDITDKVDVVNEVDTLKVGQYEVIYKINYKNYKLTKRRKVFVYEDVDPVIKLKGASSVNVCPGKEYKEEGYTATDNYDGDLTDNVIVSVDNGNISYEVSDSSFNKGTAVRTITYADSEKPKIKLKGKQSASLYIGNKYVEAGYEASDNCDGNLTNKVKVSGSVNTNKKGAYTLTYEVSDSYGNVTNVSRTVYVYDFNVDNVNEYIKSLEYYINSKNYHVSIGYYNFNTGYTYTYNAGKIYYGASLVKTVDAIYAYEKMNLTPEIKNLVKKAISVSDNDAHRKLVDMIGRNNLKAYADNVIGTKNFLTYNFGTEYYYGNTTVYDQMAIWKYLYKVIHNNSNGNELKSYFINDYGAFLIFNNSPTIMHKYGKANIYYHDVGIVFANSPYIVIILTSECCGNERNIISDLSSKIYKLNDYID